MTYLTGFLKSKRLLVEAQGTLQVSDVDVEVVEMCFYFHINAVCKA